MEALPTPVTTLQLSADEAAYVEVCLPRWRVLLALAGTVPGGQILARFEEAAVELAQATCFRNLKEVVRAGQQRM